jgi:hypothetical protein
LENAQANKIDTKFDNPGHDDKKNEKVNKGFSFKISLGFPLQRSTTDAGHFECIQYGPRTTDI